MQHAESPSLQGLKPRVISEGLRGAESAALPRWRMHSRLYRQARKDCLPAQRSPTKKHLTAKDAKSQRKTRMSCRSEFRQIRNQKHLTAEVAEVAQRSQRLRRGRRENQPAFLALCAGLQKSRDTVRFPKKLRGRFWRPRGLLCDKPINVSWLFSLSFWLPC